MVGSVLPLSYMATPYDFYESSTMKLFIHRKYQERYLMDN